MRARRLFVALFVVGAIAINAFGQERYLRPIDEAKQDPSFYAFRTRLISATEARDIKFILSILDRNIEVSFGGHKGISGFKEYWEIDKPTSKFWDEFLIVLKNGGAFERKNGRRVNLFVAPYTYASFPDLDAYEHSVIFGSNINLRERPETTAGVIDKLSYNIVKIEETIEKKGLEEADWYRVATLGGKKGWIKAEYVRSPLDYRAAFEKKRGQWKMTVLISGD